MQLHELLAEKLKTMSSEEFEQLNRQLEQYKAQGMSTERYLKKVAELLGYDKLIKNGNC